MSFTPYEHVYFDNGPVYIGASTLRDDSEEPLMRSTNEVTKMVLGKRKISGPFVPPPPLKGLEHATSEGRSPSRPLKLNAGPSTSPALSCNTTKPKAVARDPRRSTMPCAATIYVNAPERPQDPRRRRSHKDGGSSLFVGQDSSPSTQKNKPPSPSKPPFEPRTHDGGDPKILKGHTELNNVMSHDPAKTGLPTTGSSRSPNLELNPKVDDEVSECVHLVVNNPLLELSDNAFLLSHSWVNIFVGANRTVHPVHRNILCQHSEVFRLRFQETQPGSAAEDLVLPMTEEKAFQPVLDWLYSGSLGHVTVGINRLYLIYYLAEELGISALGNLVMDTIRERYRTDPSPGLSYPGIGRVHEVYRRTTINSPLRRFVLQTAYWNVMEDGTDVKYYTARSDVTGEFVRDFIKATQEKVGDGVADSDPRSCAPCNFHVHKDGSRCDTSTAAEP